VVLAFAIEVEAHVTNHNILSRYRGITAKQTPITAVTAGFQENVIPSMREFPRDSHRIPVEIPKGLYCSRSRATLYITANNNNRSTATQLCIIVLSNFALTVIYSHGF